MAKAKTINDGAYENAMTGLGKKGMDKSAHTRASAYVPANLAELSSMKVQDGIASFIVDGFPEAALMNDISITNDTEGKALKTASQIGLLKAIKKAGSALRLTGGAVVVTDDEGDIDIKEEPKAGSPVKGYRVYSAGMVDLQSPDFDKSEEPSVFRVNIIGGGTVEVHPSRCTVFHGPELPDTITNTLRERYFGVSALYPVEQSLKDLAAVSGSIINMAQETGTLLLRLSNLNLMLSKPNCGIEEIHKVMSLVKLTMNSMRAAFASDKDGFQILSHNFGGLPEVWTKCMMMVSAKARIPMSILFGQSATGLAQTNEGDTQAWCQSVDMWRNEYLYRPSCSLLADLAKRNLKKDYSEFTWGSVDEMTLKQTLEARKMQAETLEIYYNMGSISEEEVRSGVFVNGHSWEVSVEEDSPLPPPPQNRVKE